MKLKKPSTEETRPDKSLLREKYQGLLSGLRIDKNSLDEDLIRQPVLFQEVSEQYVFACANRDTAKEALALVDARLADSLRTEWSASGERYSETRVGDAVQCHPEHREAYGKWSELAMEADYLQALQRSFDQRGKMLRELSSLFVTGYFSRSSSAAGAREESSARAAMAKEGMRQLRQQRSRSE